MRELKLNFANYYNNETESFTEVYYFTLGDTIYDNSMFLIEMGGYENTIEDPDNLHEVVSTKLGLFTDDETEEVVHQLVCADAHELHISEIKEVVISALKTVKEHNERLNK